MNLRAVSIEELEALEKIIRRFQADVAKATDLRVRVDVTIGADQKRDSVLLFDDCEMPRVDNVIGTGGGHFEDTVVNGLTFENWVSGDEEG